MKNKPRHHRPFKKTYAIICEGQDEVRYFQMLKRNEPGLSINIDPKLPSKKSLREQFVLACKHAQDYHKVFWIVDYDQILHNSRQTPKGKQTPMDEFNKYCSCLKEEYDNIHIIINHPCFEFWFLLHFSQKGSGFSKCDFISKMLKSYLPGYSKTLHFFTQPNHDIYLRLKPNLADAIQRSKTLSPFDFLNPGIACSEMYLLFEELEIKQ